MVTVPTVNVRADSKVKPAPVTGAAEIAAAAWTGIGWSPAPLVAGGVALRSAHRNRACGERLVRLMHDGRRVAE